MEWLKRIQILAVLFGAFAFAGEPTPDFDRQIFANGIGPVRLVYKYTGDPVIRPTELEIWVRCGSNKQWKPVGHLEMCNLGKYSYDPATKTLNVKYQDGRVNAQTGEVFCDQIGENKISLANICK